MSKHPLTDFLRAFGTPRGRMNSSRLPERDGTRLPDAELPEMGLPYSEAEIERAMGAWDFSRLLEDLYDRYQHKPSPAVDLNEQPWTPAMPAMPAMPPMTAHPSPQPESGHERARRLSPAVGRVLDEVWDEVERAMSKHASMHSPHEGISVIREEFEELWDEIKPNAGGRDNAARKEAVQLAAMAVRYIVDLDPKD